MANGGLLATSIMVIGLGAPTPGNSLLTIVNPFSRYAVFGLAPQVLDVPAVVSSPPAASLAADGQSAVVLVYRSKSSQPVKLDVSASGAGLSGSVGYLGSFDSNYLTRPNPAIGNVQSFPVNAPTSGPDAAGVYTFLALLWAPNSVPAQGFFPAVDLTVTGTQWEMMPEQASIEIQPPPLLLVHGIWSDSEAAGFSQGSGGLYDWILNRYPHSLIYAVDYKDQNFKAFDDSLIQGKLLVRMRDAIAAAATSGMAARTVDIVGHSMGGLVARYLISQAPSLPATELLSSPVHKLITIGTPNLGSELAEKLEENKDSPPIQLLPVSPLAYALCLTFTACTLGEVMNVLDKPVGTGVESLEPAYPPLARLSSSTFSAITGEAPPSSLTEGLLDALITPWLPGQSVASILGEPNDTIVDADSQQPGPVDGQIDSATVKGVVHSSICVLGFCPDVGETQSPQVWQQAYYWLTGISPAPSSGPILSAFRGALAPAATVPAPVLDLTGYAEVAASNVTISPATGAALTINSASSITATSSTKTITEILLLQTVVDPSDTVLLYATQAPFTIPFTPTRLGSASFTAISVFSDNTFAVKTLNYTLQPSGSPTSMNLVNAPVANMAVGSSQAIETDAWFNGGPVNVSEVATYSARSGSTNVFSISSGGLITANGNGVDLLNVSYGGLTATAQVAVGACTYALNPSNQIVPNTGGTVTIQVTTQPGCAWTASGSALWLPFTQPSGSGNGTITLMAAANNTGSAQAALVTLAGLQVFEHSQPSPAFMVCRKPKSMLLPQV